MYTIALLGDIQHELLPNQANKLVEYAKQGCEYDNVLVMCGAQGLFTRPAKLSAQVKMLFDSNIDCIFLGENAATKNAARTVLQENFNRIIRPINQADDNLGASSFEVTLNNKSIIFVTIAELGNKLALNDEIKAIKSFLDNNKKAALIFIAYYGMNINLKEAVVNHFAANYKNICWFGFGIGKYIEAEKYNSGNWLINDIGSIKGLKSIEGTTPQIWWQRKIQKIPVPILPPSTDITADLIYINLDSTLSISKITHRKIIV